METRRFARSGNVFICGVCAGLAEYIGMNVTLMRVLWVVLTVCTYFWLGVLAYVVLSFVMAPAEGAPAFAWQGVQGRGIMIVLALALICLGAWIIVQEFLHINLNKYLLPVGLIAGGVLLLSFALRGKNGKQS